MPWSCRETINIMKHFSLFIEDNASWKFVSFLQPNRMHSNKKSFFRIMS